MSEFKKVDHASFSPTQCVLCGAHEGPFVDTEVEMVGYGPVWLCESCVRQMAQLFNLVERELLQAALNRLPRSTSLCQPPCPTGRRWELQ